jgi:hypothetical protein
MLIVEARLLQEALARQRRNAEKPLEAAFVSAAYALTRKKAMLLAAPGVQLKEEVVRRVDGVLLDDRIPVLRLLGL